MSKISNEDKEYIKKYFKDHNCKYKIYKLLAKKYSCSLNLIIRIIDPIFNIKLKKIARINYLKKCYEKKKDLLDPIQQRIIKKRLFDKMLLSDIGKDNGFSKERARQIVSKSIKIISDRPNSRRYEVI
jgi:hypothetical protein